MPKRKSTREQRKTPDQSPPRKKLKHVSAQDGASQRGKKRKNCVREKEDAAQGQAVSGNWLTLSEVRELTSRDRVRNNFS